MRFTQYDLKQRQSDKKWQLWAKYPDTENAYEFVNENGNRAVLVPEVWVVIGVYDYLLEVEEWKNG